MKKKLYVVTAWKHNLSKCREVVSGNAELKEVLKRLENEGYKTFEIHDVYNSSTRRYHL